MQTPSLDEWNHYHEKSIRPVGQLRISSCVCHSAYLLVCHSAYLLVYHSAYLLVCPAAYLVAGCPHDLVEFINFLLIVMSITGCCSDTEE